MAVPEIGSRLRRDILLGVLALTFLTAPLWVGVLGIGETEYTYERAEVTATDTGIEYIEPDEAPRQTPLSDAVECTGWGDDIRICALEAKVLEEPIEAGITTSNPNLTPAPTYTRADYYQYIQMDDGVYEPSFDTNSSAQDSAGMYPVKLELEPVAAEDALDQVSLDPDDAPSVVAETAQTGSTTTTGSVDVPETPLIVEDEAYYRVYQDRGDTPSTAESNLAYLLTYIGPLVGLFLALQTFKRIEISYTNERDW